MSRPFLLKCFVIFRAISRKSDERNPEELSEYELIRLANIEEREEMFEKLGLNNFKQENYQSFCSL